MTQQADDLGIPMKPVPLLPPRPVPPRPADLLPRASSAAPAEPSAAAGARAEQTEPRQLIVGHGVLLSGEITTCDRLVIEGSVEANLHNCHDVNVSETGLFKGIASIDNAEVRGRVEGELVVRKRLLIRATGHVSGKIAYSEIEIEHGGKISGTIGVHRGDEFVTDQPRTRRTAAGD